MVVDSGTYVYTSDPPARNAFRSTAAHNSVRVDEEELNPIDPAHLFRLRQVATVRADRTDERNVVVSHNGYRRLTAGPIIHRRTFALGETGCIGITDELQGSGQHRFEWFLHLAPGTEVIRASGDDFELTRQGAGLKLRWDTDTALAIAVEPGWVSERFGWREEAPVIVARAQVQAPVAVHLSMVAAVRRSVPQRIGLAT